MATCSVIILNWNGAKMLRQFLPNVLRNTNDPDYEVIVADNGSTDDSIDAVQEINTSALTQGIAPARPASRKITNRPPRIPCRNRRWTVKTPLITGTIRCG